MGSVGRHIPSADDEDVILIEDDQVIAISDESSDDLIEIASDVAPSPGHVVLISDDFENDETEISEFYQPARKKCRSAFDRENLNLVNTVKNVDYLSKLPAVATSRILHFLTNDDLYAMRQVPEISMFTVIINRNLRFPDYFKIKSNLTRVDIYRESMCTTGG